MSARADGSRPTVRGMARYAAISLVPVLVLGLALAASYRFEARRRGVAEGRSAAMLVANTAIAPLLDGRPLAAGVSPAERAELDRLWRRAAADHDLLRLRLRDLNGNVVYSDDGSGFATRPEDEALAAAQGRTEARLTRINTDRNDTGPAGVSAVEVYLPLEAGWPAARVGVLETYLPYAPISRDITAGLRMLYLNLAVGLLLLYLVLFAVSASVSRGLRRQLSINAHLAEHDPLTDLPNRTVFHRRARRALAKARRRGGAVVIAIIDLDRFKEVNDTLGHHNGDRLLVEVARRLAESVGSADTVARLGGDEFGVVLAGHEPAEAALVRLRHAIDHDIEVGGLPIAVEASVGFVVAPEDGLDVDTLLQHADVAMYVAKAQHGGVVRYDPAHDHYDAAKLGLVADLRRAIDADELVLHYQPKVSLQDGRIEAVEALLRWWHPHLGLLGPDRFLPLAEQTEIIDRLTDWVVNRALTDLRGLGPVAEGLSVAVNISARNLARAGFGEHVAGSLDRVGVAPDRLILEITETALVSDPPHAATVLRRLAADGVRVSIDDFGCGQTSLGYLSALPIDELKIDKSFVIDMAQDATHAAIVRSIVDLGHNLALRVVGEGVETESALASLRATGCDVAQGFLLAKPMPLAELREWLEPGHERERAPLTEVASPIHG